MEREEIINEYLQSYRTLARYIENEYEVKYELLRAIEVNHHIFLDSIRELFLSNDSEKYIKFEYIYGLLADYNSKHGNVEIEFGASKNRQKISILFKEAYRLSERFYLSVSGNSHNFGSLQTKTQTETKTEQETPKTFEELFYNPEHAEPCLKILSELHPPVIDAKNNYIGKAKGVFPLWVKVLKNHKPEPLIKHFKDAVYKDLLNQKVNGLKLSKDASEFRKQYKRVENDKIELDIKTILSQYSQNGKLGK